MKTRRKTEVVFLKGIDQKIPPAEQTAQKIVNFTVDPRTGGWDSRIGYEKFQTSAPLYGPFNDDTEIFSTYAWQTQNGAIQFYLYEKFVPSLGADTGLNQLCSVWGNPTVETNFREWFTGLIRGGTDQPGVNYVPYGRFLIVMNGQNRPIRIDSRTGEGLQMGWSDRPSALDPWAVDQDDSKPSSSAGMPILDYGSVQAVSGFASSGKLEIYGNSYGLGYPKNDSENSYRWKVSFISDSGSESPMSAASDALSWTTSASAVPPTATTGWYLSGPPINPRGAFGNHRQAVFLEGLPVGPVGTVARRIYRTRNLGEFETGDAANYDAGIIGDHEVYYYVGQINNNYETNYVDYTADTALVTNAPLDSDSIPWPTPSPRYGASYYSRLFMDGGPGDQFRIYYSNPNQPESFSALSYFDYGSREGGAITGLHVYNSQLLVFRERAIDVIRPSMGEFITVPFVQGIGTQAHDTITTIPNLGVVFLGNDGIYLIAGTNEGGSSLNIERISDPILGTIERINKSLIGRSCAAYSSTWNEWHCYVPLDGNDKPNLGIVLHTDKIAWSTREGFPVGCLTTDLDGNLVFGNKDGKPDGWVVPQHYEAGLFVISKKRIGGYTVAGDPPVTTEKPPLTSTYKTAWMDFGYPAQKKYVKYIYLYVLTEGDNTIPITYFKDYSTTGTTTVGRKLQRPEFPDQVVYDTAVWDTAAWTEGMLTEIRYPVANEAVSHFAFEISTTEDIILLGYAVEYETTNLQTAKGKMS